MKRLFISLIAGMLAVSALFAQPTPRKGTPINGVVRVKLQPELVEALPKATDITPKSAGTLQVGVKHLDASLRKIGGVKMRKVFPCAPEREAEHRKYGLDLWYEISFDKGVSPLEARNVLKNTAGVQKAQVRVPMTLIGDGTFREADLSVLASKAKGTRAADGAMPFDDPRLPMQWHYHNDGSLASAVPGADINLFKAWEICTGSPDVLVAIIDGGVDVKHEDLQEHMWINTAELNGKPGIDDDGDGYIDDVYGYNFCTNEGAIYPHTHGTHVAGTVGAVNNNGLGVCGVAGGDGTPGSGVRMMSCQVFDSRSGAGKGDFAAAIIYAADHGAVIAQCSWGWSEDGYYEQDVLDAIRYFTNSARSDRMTGGLCIFATGNDSSEGEFYPGCMEEVVAVASMTHMLQPASYSNYGTWVDVTAPGGLMDFDSQQGVLSTLPDNTYGYNEGTSMAAPHVSGIAALVLSKYGSATLTNESLRQQLVTAVNDLYTLNPQAEGLFGSGYVDAYKALQWGDGTAPSPVSDLTAVAMQESIELHWTIPASSSGSVNNHILYYSTLPFTEKTLDACKTIIIDTKFDSSGDKYEYEITKLSPITTYYIAMRAVDRWGNASKLSPVISITTNRGPKMTISRTSMAMNCTDGATWPTRTFDIGNDDEGLLKWSVSAYTASSLINAYANGDLLTVPYSGRIDVQPCAANKAKEVVRDLEDFVQNDYPQSIAYHTGIFAYVGDKDYPNSMAQRFTVNKSLYPKGFNLTHVRMDGNYGKHPIIEVYRGGSSVSAANLLVSYDAGENAVTYNYDHALPIALHFRPGETFFVVVHFEGYDERNYPLGLAMGNGSAEATQAYLSNDKGKTWAKLAEALVGSNYEQYKEEATWCIDAISKFPDWSEVLDITPAEGQLKMGEKQTVTVKQNGTPLPNGSYRAKLFFNTNESEKNDLAITVSLNVSGQVPDVSYNKVVEFGNILVGQSKTVAVEVFNKGYGNFSGGETYSSIFSSNISSTSPHFHGPEYQEGGLPARATTRVELTYAPVEAGNHSGVVVFKDKDGRELRFNVTGSATEPAKIAVNPESVNVGELDASGETKTVTFDIENHGQYPLQFVMPKFSDETFDNVVSKASTHRFGYVWQSNLYGGNEVQYDGKPNLIDAVDISDQFGDYNYFSNPIDIGFDFPFYGKNYTQIYVSSFGLLSFAPYREGLIYNMYPTCSYAEGLGVISVYGNEFQVSPTSKVEYTKRDGKFVVNFKDVLVTVYDKETMPASFHVALSPSGDIEIAFDDYNPDRVFQQGCNLWVGIVDPEQKDELTVTSSEQTTMAYWYDDKSEENNRWRYIHTGTAFKFSAPKPNMIASIAPSSGIISSGDKMTVTAVVKATDEMFAGDTYTDLVIQSNDLTASTKLVRFNATVVGDLQPQLALTKEAVDFGSVFRTSTAQLALGVLNTGRSNMMLQDVKVAGGKFTTSFTEPVEIPAGQSRDIIVTLPTQAEGEVADALTVTTTAGSKTVELKGTVIGVPQLSLSYTSVQETLPSGESKQLPLTVTNTGNEALEYSIIAGSHLSYAPDYQPGSTTEYTYVSSLDDPSAAREWIDIETTGLGTQYNYTHFLKRDIVEVELPFTFTFYDKAYTKMYVYDSGFVSFTERKDEGGIWPEPPYDYPNGSVYTNLIAPYWGLHTMDVTATAGVFTYTDSEQAVVSFIEYGNSMNVGVDFQLVLRKDGSFTFNYKPAFAHAVIFGAFGVAGILREEGDGIRLSERYIALNSSLTFSPVVHNTLLPGESAVADVTLNANELAGRYTTRLTVNTNVPTQPVTQIPVTLNITGTPAPVFPEDIVVEQVAEYINGDRLDELASLGAFWYIPFEVANTGSAPFTITGIDIESPQIDGNDIFTLYHYGTYIDAWTEAEVTGWCPYTGRHMTVGRGAARFALPVWANDYSLYAWQTPGEYKVKLTLHISGVEGVTTKTLNITCRVTEQPVMAIDREEIRIKVEHDSDVKIETFNLSNAEGRYPLRYTITVDPTGVGEATSPQPSPVGEGAFKSPSQQITPSPSLQSNNNSPSPVGEGRGEVSLQPFDVGRSDFMYDAPDEEQGFNYNRALYWPALQSSTVAYNYGTTTTYGIYKAATAFVGPEGGFNISHIYFAMHPFNIDGKDVEIEIVNGDPQTSDDVIGHGTYHIDSQGAELYQNIRVVAALDRPVYISEGQNFYVVLTFPTGQEYPSTLIRKQDQLVSNRYLGYWDNYGWFDVATLFNATYGSLGYLTSCLETNEGDAWVKVLDPSTGEPASTISGEIAAGETAEVKVRISAAEAPKDTDNKAVLVIRGNDPKNPVANFPVWLDKNSAPVVSTEADNLFVREGESISFTATVIDAEDEDFTITLNDDAMCATITSAKPIVEQGRVLIPISNDRRTATIRGIKGGVMITVALAPSYGTAGTHKLAIKTTDSGRHTAVHNLQFAVQHVNQAPVAKPLDFMAVQTGTLSEVIDLASLFTDPDDNAHTFTVKLSDENVATIFRSDNTVIFRGLKEGKTTVTVTCTDPEGAAATLRFTLYVADDITGIAPIPGTSSDAPAYDLLGRPLPRATMPGIYIQGGKKKSYKL